MKTQILGYCRVSTRQQKLGRQIDNIKEYYPALKDTNLYCDKFTGKTTNRPAFNRLIKTAKKGDTIIFDSVSRMSRNANEGINQYFDFYKRGINLVFLKEPTINTSIYKDSLNKIELPKKSGDTATDTLIQSIIKALNDYMTEIAKNQINEAFRQAEKERKDIVQRIKEGQARTEKHIGLTKGAKKTIKQKERIKNEIVKLSKEFNGTLIDTQVIAVINGTHYKDKETGQTKTLKTNWNTYRKYKQELYQTYESKE